MKASKIAQMMAHALSARTGTGINGPTMTHMRDVGYGDKSGAIKNYRSRRILPKIEERIMKMAEEKRNRKLQRNRNKKSA